MENKKETAQEMRVQEQLNVKEANQLLWQQFKRYASCEQLKETEFKNMLEIYSILFPFRP
ncbi:hypothetical protein [Clostridium sartagoforme]|uniref:hypothetical protein n=1 Tax=Clostridium sartagoforme TaxID=84031 RepID=UPI0003AB3F30|nr:hypothetical protein [Clostridium sartagoforme]